MSVVEKPPVGMPALPSEGSPSKRILQLTDIHLDLRYAKESKGGWPNVRGVDTTDGGLPAPPPVGSPTQRILQLTDIHLDLRYAKVDTTSRGASSPSSWFSNQEDPPAHRHPS
jgi:hypothetical protein